MKESKLRIAFEQGFIAGIKAPDNPHGVEINEMRKAWQKYLMKLRDGDFDFDKKAAQEWIKKVRPLAHNYAETYGRITADDIWSISPPPDNVDPRNMGKIFQGMKRVATIKSKRGVCHHREIGVFTL